MTEAGAPLRTLMLATYFPKPGNPRMGTWALQQARALAEVTALTVVSPSSYLPRWTGTLCPRSRHWSHCPATWTWDDLTVHYPRWLFYQGGPIKRLVAERPEGFLETAWLSIRDRLLRIVEAVRPQVVYAHHAVGAGYLARRLHDLTGLPYVVTLHSVADILLGRCCPSRRRVFRQVLLPAAATVAVSGKMVPELKAVVPEARVEVVYNGATLPEDVVPMQLAGLPKDAVVLCSVGALTEQKGMVQLVEAFLSIADRHPETVLVLAGEGPMRRAIESRIAGHPAGGRIRLLGEIEHSRVMALMQRADVFALVGHHEAFGVVYAEALACGCPVVYSADAGFAEVMTGGVHGLVVPPQDVSATAAALDRLLAGESERRRMGRAGRELVEKTLLWSAHARTMDTLFRRVVNLNRGPMA